MFAGKCQAQGKLGASFFFRRGHPKRGSWNGLFTTIAYQLATSVPELLLPIQQAMESDKLVAGRAITVQFQRLFAAPLQSTPALRLVPIIVLDGLDECADHKVQQKILRLFITAIRDHQLPIRLLIASRHEPHIRETLETEEAFAICRHSVLFADEVAYDDIRTYLHEEFSRIQTERTARGINLGTSWPPLGATENLVIRSSGIFIYATTVIRFIDDEYSHPMDRLEAVLHLDPRSTAPLDDLYTEILSVVPPELQQLRILHAIWQGTLDGYLAMDPEEMDMLFVLRQGTCRQALRHLHSLLEVPCARPRFAKGNWVKALHASLGDYLGDARRSGRWCVSTSWLHSDHLSSLIRLLASPRITVKARFFHR